MPIGLSFSPYSSRITLLIQYQSPFLKSLTFIFSSDMATNNKGVIDLTDRALFLPSRLAPLRGEEGAVYHSLDLGRARSMLSIARQKSRRIVGFSSSRMVKLVSRLSRLQRSSFLVGGFRVIRLHILRKSLLIRIFVVMFFDVIHVIQ